MQPGQASFVLISFNPEKQPKFFSFKGINDSADYRMYNLGNIHTSEEYDDVNSANTILVNLRQMKRKAKIETIQELLKTSVPKPVSDLCSEVSRPPWQNQRSVASTRAQKDSISAQQKGIDPKIQARMQLSDLIAGEKLTDIVDFDGDSRVLKTAEKAWLEPILMRQEKMLQTVIDLLQRGNSPQGDQRSTVKSNQQTVSIGTNTTMRANELQQFMGEVGLDDPQNNSIGFHSNDPFGGPVQPKKKIISVGPERNSLSRTLSGMPKSDNESKSSRRVKEKDETQPSPGEDSASENRMQANRVRHYVDDSISIRSSNVNQFESSSIHLGKHLDRYRQPKHDSSLNYGSSAVYQKPVTPPVQAHHKRQEYQQPFSPQFTTNDRHQFGRATDSGLTRGTNTESPIDDLRLLKGSSYQETVQSRDTRPARKIQTTGSFGLPSYRDEGSIPKLGVKLDASEEEIEQSKPKKDRLPDPNSKLSILQELEANVKACEYDQGGGKATFEIPRIFGEYKDYSTPDSDDEETRNIQYNYKISK